MGILAPMAWNRAGDSRKSLISTSSATASSAPATSAKVTLGWSLLPTLGLALPNCITRFPPPCIEYMMNRNTPNSRISGSQLASVARKLSWWVFESTRTPSWSSWLITFGAASCG